MQRRTIAAIMISIVLLAAATSLIGFGGASVDVRTARGDVGAEMNELAAPEAKGFSVMFEKSALHAEHEQLLRQGNLDRVAHELNRYAQPTKAVPIVFKECGESGAYYDVNTEDITFCYEFIDEFSSVFTYARETEAERDQAVVDAAAFIIAHEAGHATVDLHKIPFTGKEEDVADQFATLILTNMNYGEAAVAGGEVFRLLGKRDGQFNLWSEHALDEQRYYNMLCWTYGADNNYDVLDLPLKRQKSCVREYNNIKNSWEQLI